MKWFLLIIILSCTPQPQRSIDPEVKTIKIKNSENVRIYINADSIQ